MTRMPRYGVLSTHRPAGRYPLPRVAGCVAEDAEVHGFDERGGAVCVVRLLRIAADSGGRGLASLQGDAPRRTLVQSASAAISPVRMRTTLSSAATKILPSPIFPVRAALVMVSITSSIEPRVVDCDIELDLRKEVHHVLGAPVELGVPFLPAESLDLGDGHPLNADLRQCGPYVIELERFDDRGNEMHRCLSLDSRWLLGACIMPCPRCTKCQWVTSDPDAAGITDSPVRRAETEHAHSVMHQR